MLAHTVHATCCWCALGVCMRACTYLRLCGSPRMSEGQKCARSRGTKQLHVQVCNKVCTCSRPDECACVLICTRACTTQRLRYHVGHMCKHCVMIAFTLVRGRACARMRIACMSQLARSRRLRRTSSRVCVHVRACFACILSHTCTSHLASARTRAKAHRSSTQHETRALVRMRNF